jgi:hypothetical protein
VLFDNLKDRFKDAWYWLAPAAVAGNAWFQTFGTGLQDWDVVSDRGRARAVRRIPIR